MTIKKIVEEDKIIISLEGRLDTMTSPELERELSALEEEEKELPLQLTMDLRNLKYMSSAGLRILLSLHRKMEQKGGELIVRCTEAGQVRDTLKMTGFLDFLHLEDNGLVACETGGCDCVKKEEKEDDH